METIVDQLDAVNSNSFLKEIKNPENIKDLIIKNYNKDTEWGDLDKFINLEKLQLNNCLIENNSFFLSISKIKKLKIFKYDYECYFKSSEEKTKINLLSINKIILDFKSSEDIFNFFENSNYSLFTLKGFIGESSPLSKYKFNDLYNRNKEYYFLAMFKVW